MVDTTIAGLTEKTTPDDGDVVEVDTGAASRKVQAKNLLHATQVSESFDPSAVANVDIDVSGDFDYEIEGRVLPSTDAADTLSLRCSTDGGTNFDSAGNYESMSSRVNVATNAARPVTGATLIKLHDFFIGGAAGEGVEFRIRFTKPSDGSFQFLFNWEVAKLGGGNDLQWEAGAGLYTGGNGVNALRLFFDSGANFSSGHITVRKKKRS